MEDVPAIRQHLTEERLQQLRQHITRLEEARDSLMASQDRLLLIIHRDVEGQRDSVTAVRDLASGRDLVSEQDLQNASPSPSLSIKSGKISTATQYLRILPRVSLQELPSDRQGCDICLTEYNTGEESENPVRLPCGHVFGDDCLSKWLSSSEATKTSTCPVCRAVLFDFHEFESLLELLRSDPRIKNAQDELDAIRGYFKYPRWRKIEMERSRRLGAEADLEAAIRGSDTPSLKTILRAFDLICLDPRAYTFEEAHLFSQRMGQATTRLGVVVHDPRNKDDLLIFSDAPRVTLERRSQIVFWGPEGPGATRIFSSEDWRKKIAGTLAVFVAIEAVERHFNTLPAAAR